MELSVKAKPSWLINEIQGGIISLPHEVWSTRDASPLIVFDSYSLVSGGHSE